MAPGAITPRAARRALHFQVLVALSKNKYRIGGVTLLALVLSGAGLSYAKRWNARLRRKSARSSSLAPHPPPPARRSGGSALGRLAPALVRQAAPKLAALLALSLARTALSNRLARVQGYLFRAAFLRRVPLFARDLSENVILCLAASLLESSARHVSQRMSLGWRETLTRRLQSAYFSQAIFYRLSHVARSVDAPEARLCDDVPQLCGDAADLAAELLAAAVDAAFYAVALRRYTKTHAYTGAIAAYVVGAGVAMAWAAPNFAGLFRKQAALEGAYRAAHARLRASAEPVAFCRGSAAEAELIRSRLRDALRHRARLLARQWRFGVVQDLFLKYMGATVAVGLIIGPFFGGRLRPDATVEGRARMLADMRYHTAVVISLFTAMGTLGSATRKVMRLAGLAQRVDEMERAMSALGDEDEAGRGGKASERGAAVFRQAEQSPVSSRPPSSASSSRPRPAREGSRSRWRPADLSTFTGEVLPAEGCIAWEDACVVTPSGALLVKDLTLRVPRGTNLLVTGPNGAGKSSLFRVLGGLWPLASGRLYKPGGSQGEGLHRDIFYVPQRPYVSVGTLQEQLLYPLVPVSRRDDGVEGAGRAGEAGVEGAGRAGEAGVEGAGRAGEAGVEGAGRAGGGGEAAGRPPLLPTSTAAIPEPELRALLRAVDLEHLMDFERASGESVRDWGEVLSLGEQQRLGMARLFFHRPKFAILDECTSGVSVAMEERFCAMVEAAGCSCITISHRPALVAHHDLVLALDGEGGWSLHAGGRQAAGAAAAAALSAHQLRQASDATGRGSRRADAAEVFRAMERVVEAGSVGGGLGEEDWGGRVVARAPPLAVGEMVVLDKKAAASQLGYSPCPSSLPNSAPADPPLPSLARASRASQLSRWRLVLSTLAAESPKETVGAVVAVAAVVSLRTLLQDRIAQLNGRSVDLVLRQDLPGFLRLVLQSVLQSAASAVLAPALRHLADLLALRWRARLSRAALAPYLRGRAFYSAAALGGLSDADQRLARDVDRLCSDLAGLLPQLVKPAVDAAWFTRKLYALSGRPGAALLYVYAAGGFALLKRLSPDFGGLAAREERLEGEFRASHARLRAHAESVAFFGGGAREGALVDARLGALAAHLRGFQDARWAYAVADDFVARQLPHSVTWVLSLWHALGARGDFSDARFQGDLVHRLRYLASVVSQTFAAWGDLVAMPRRVAEIGGGVGRVADAILVSRAAAEWEEGCERGRGEEGSGEAPFLAPPPLAALTLDRADVETPRGRLLARQLSLAIPEGEPLLITGPNGSGKTSVLRVLAGLWPLRSGAVGKLPRAPPAAPPAVFFVPQTPYAAPGTLRAQVLYPLTPRQALLRYLAPGADPRALDCRDAGRTSGGERASSAPAAAREACEKPDLFTFLDAELDALMGVVRLGYLVEREGGWDAVRDWADVLSLGELQRLGMARLFFHRPRFGVLDECTNGTSVDVEEAMYAHAAGLGITLVTVSQRRALLKFHRRELRMLERGDWELAEIADGEGKENGRIGERDEDEAGEEMLVASAPTSSARDAA